MKCPDCGKNLKPVQTTCMCGWTEQSKEMPISDHGCSHMEYGVRCKKPGTRSNNIKGGGPWYCGEHFNN